MDGVAVVRFKAFTTSIAVERNMSAVVYRTAAGVRGQRAHMDQRWRICVCRLPVCILLFPMGWGNGVPIVMRVFDVRVIPLARSRRKALVHAPVLETDVGDGLARFKGQIGDGQEGALGGRDPLLPQSPAPIVLHSTIRPDDVRNCRVVKPGVHVPICKRCIGVLFLRVVLSVEIRAIPNVQLPVVIAVRPPGRDARQLSHTVLGRIETVFNGELIHPA